VKKLLCAVQFCLLWSITNTLSADRKTTMNDEQVTIETVKLLMKKFVDERDWNQFHTPKNLSMKMAIEAAELMELFTWQEGLDSFETARQKRQEVEQELADVIMVALAFANACSIDISKAIMEKLALNEQRYPVEKCKSKSDKYTAYIACKDKRDAV